MKTILQKITSGALCFALLLGYGSLASCSMASPGPSDKNSILIGVSVYNGYDMFISVLMDSFKAQARTREAEAQITITIQHENAADSQITQNAQVESFIEAGCDIICVNLVDRTEASFIIDKAEAAGIPILFFNRELVEEDLERWDQLFYVGAEAQVSGAMQAQLVADLCAVDMDRVDKNGDGVIQYVMLEGEPGHQDAIVRTEYTLNTMMDLGYRLEKLEDEIANWNRAQAEAKMTSWLAIHGHQPDMGEQITEGKCIEVVFSNNDEMALGAIDALKRADIPQEEWPIIVGIDGTPDGLAAVQRGEMYGTVHNDSPGQAKGLLDLSMALTFGTEMPAELEGNYIRLPYQIVTRQNVEEYIASYAE